MVHYFPTAIIIMISKQILQHSCNSDSFYHYDISQTHVFSSLYTNTGKQNQPTCTQRGSIYMFYNNHLHRWRMYFIPSNFGTLFHPLSHSLSSAMFHHLDYHFLLATAGSPADLIIVLLLQKVVQKDYRLFGSPARTKATRGGSPV